MHRKPTTESIINKTKKELPIQGITFFLNNFAPDYGTGIRIFVT